MGTELIDALLQYGDIDDCVTIKNLCSSLGDEKCTEDMYRDLSNRLWNIGMGKNEFNTVCDLLKGNLYSISDLKIGNFNFKVKKELTTSKSPIYGWGIDINYIKNVPGYIFYEADSEKDKRKCLHSELINVLKPLVDMYMVLNKDK